MTFIKSNFSVPTNQNSHIYNTNTQNNSTISFGYDKKLSKTVEHRANMADMPEIVILQNMCNTLEDGIRAKETCPNVDENDYYEVHTMLIPLKKALAEIIENYFPRLNYTAIESAHYIDEDCVYIYQKGWRAEVSDSLEESLKARKKDKNPKTNCCDTPKVSENASKDTEKKKINSIIKMFEPNEYTPKGFADVAGMDQIKKELQKWIIDPIKDPEINVLRRKYGIKMPNGFMLYGPPGCGKTFIAESLAAEADIPLFKLKISEAGSIYIHESSKNYKLAFDEVERKAKELNKPCILFIDEIDGLASARDSLSSESDFKVEEINTLLDLLNGASARGIIVLAATNNPGGVDKAIKRSGRFDKELYVGLPDEQARLSKIKLDLSRREKANNILNNEEALSKIVDKTKGYSNSDINVILESAAMKAMDRRDEILLQDILESVEENKVKKLSPEELKKYDIEPLKHRIAGFGAVND